MDESTVYRAAGELPVWPQPIRPQSQPDGSVRFWSPREELAADHNRQGVAVGDLLVLRPANGQAVKGRVTAVLQELAHQGQTFFTVQPE